MADRAADPIDVTLLVAGAIERAGGTYFVGGSLASSLQGEPRATNDVDMIVELPLARIATFVKELGGEFEVDVEMLRAALLEGGSCNILHDGGRVSDRQWRDIVQVLRVSGNEMDRAYLERWAETLGVEALLQRARQDAASVV